MKRKLKCIKCGLKNTRKNGKTKNSKQRYYCKDCKASFVIKRSDTRQRNYKVWFNKYLEGYTYKKLSEISKLSAKTLWTIVKNESNKPVLANVNYSNYKYLIFDAKYLFGRKYCLIILMDALTNIPIAAKVVKSETRKYIEPWLEELKKNGLESISVTTDGLDTVRKAFEVVFPNIITQRCLFHIKLQGQKWLRIPPRTEIGKELTAMLNRLMLVKNEQQKEQWIKSYLDLKIKYKDYLDYLLSKPAKQSFRKQLNYSKKDNYNSVKDTLKIRTAIEKDLLSTINLIDNALSNMFHYLEDKNIVRTTSPVEGYFKKVQKIKGFNHCGLTEDHLFKILEHKIIYDFNKNNEQK